MRRGPGVSFAATLVVGLLVGPACRRQAPSGSAPADPSATPAWASKQCFTAAGDAAQPAQSVFDELGRSGNGETWRAILEHTLRKRATVDHETHVPAMGHGWQYAVTFDQRNTWAGFDSEAGGTLFCTGDAGLFATMKGVYDDARKDPVKLRALVTAVPVGDWDD